MKKNSTVILLPSAESFKKGCCQLQAKVCARSTSYMCIGYSMFCVGYGIYEGAELPSVYFITNTKHCITYLALPKLFPVLLAHMPHIVKYFAAFHLGVCHFVFSHGRAFRWNKWILLAAFFFNFAK